MSSGSRRAPDVSRYKHFEGIQRLQSTPHLVLSRYQEKAKGRAAIAILELKTRGFRGGKRFGSNLLQKGVDTEDTLPWSADKVIRYLEVDRSYEHAGGIQIVGDVLAISLEKPIDYSPTGKIVFFDMSDPANPRKLP